MKVTRKLMRRFEYVSVAISSTNTMGTIELVKVTSPELSDFKVYQFIRNHSVMDRLVDYEGHVSTTTETVIDFTTYSEALGYYASIQSGYVNNPAFNTNEPTHPAKVVPNV